MNSVYTELQDRHPDSGTGDARDFLWLHIRDLPHFRSLLPAVEAQFYEQVSLQAPTLEIGYGEGHFSRLTFNRKIEVGLAPSHRSLHEVGECQAYHLLTEADGGRMPYPSAYFQSAFSNWVLEHIPHVERVLDEAARVLKPGALFVFCVPKHCFNELLSIARGVDKLRLARLAELYRTFFTYIARHRHLDSPDVWKDRLEAAGFVVEKWWFYFPLKAYAVLEWGHYLRLPALLIGKLTGRWILIPSYWKLALRYCFLQPYAAAVPTNEGVGTFHIARRVN